MNILWTRTHLVITYCKWKRLLYTQQEEPSIAWLIERDPYSMYTTQNI